MKKIIYLIAFMMFGFASAQDFTAIVKADLSSNASKLNLQPKDVNDIFVSSQSFSKSMQLHTVYVSQRYQGIEVFGSSSPFAVKDGKVISKALSFKSNMSQIINTTTPVLSKTDAIKKAAAAFGLETPSGLTVLEDISSKKTVYSNGNISAENIPVQLVFQPSDKNLKLAWDLSILLKDGSHWYSVRVDAVNGEILATNDWIVSCSFGDKPHTHNSEIIATHSVLENAGILQPRNFVDGSKYRVFPIPAESPNHATAALVSEPANVTASPFGWHDVNGVAGAEFTITRGNNVYAQDDINNNNGNDGFSPDGGASLNFDFPFNFDTRPVNMLDAVTTNLFYMNNIMHDVLYQYGFDEQSGNFQERNYSNLGLGFDSVNAQSQDGGGLNNANFGTPPEGNMPRMQMFLWNATGPPGMPLTVNNGTVAGSYSGTPAGFGNPLPTTPITQDLIIADPLEACSALTNASAIAGKIALIKRGGCEFGVKVLAAQNAGAVAAIVINNVANPLTIIMGPGASGDQVTIPSIMISQADGDAILAAISGGQVINGSLMEVGPYQVDGDLDNGIIAHEYGHGISTRLTGGALNSSCLYSCQRDDGAGNCLQYTDQMGEGWSDYFTLMLSMKPGDTPEMKRGIGTYVIGEPTSGTGIRPAAYSTDRTINNFNYGYTNTAQPPHGVGFVWATMLWDLTWDFIAQDGFDPDIYNGTGGNNKALQLVMDGLKLQACNPGFVDGRDAIILADANANGGANECLIRRAFARRGLGENATQGSNLDTKDQVENFDVRSSCALGTDDKVLDMFKIYPNPSDGNIKITTTSIGGEATVSIFDLNGRKVHNQKVFLENTVDITANGLRTGVYVIQIEGNNFKQTSKLIIK